MKDITTFLDKNSVKDICRSVYVKDGIAVATDTFKLIEIKLDDFCKDHIPNGYYDIKVWKEMCKAYNKKNPDIVKMQTIIKANNATITTHKDTPYPDYEKILEGEFKDLDINSTFTKHHLVEFIKLLPELSFQRIKLSDLKDNGKMIKYEDPYTRMVLMKAN